MRHLQALNAGNGKSIPKHDLLELEPLLGVLLINPVDQSFLWFKNQTLAFELVLFSRIYFELQKMEGPPLSGENFTPNTLLVNQN